MNVHMEPPRRARRTRVIALHCSGAGAGQWRNLGETLGGGYEVLAPEHYGCESTGPWTGRHAFTLADEAVRAIELIDMSGERVHLAGHSYGGGVALHVALARPDRIASMTLYEPAAFHLLELLDRRPLNAPGAVGSLPEAEPGAQQCRPGWLRRARRSRNRAHNDLRQKRLRCAMSGRFACSARGRSPAEKGRIDRGSQICRRPGQIRPGRGGAV